jgi:chromosome segregation ATPase
MVVLANDKLDQLVESVKELHHLIRVVLDRQEEFDAKLEAMAMDVHQLKGDVAAIKQDIAVMKGDIAELKDGQQRHERILETLALRSLEMEIKQRDNLFNK